MPGVTGIESVKALEAKIDQAAQDAVQAAAEAGKAEADRVGGQFFGGKAQMTARIDSRFGSGNKLASRLAGVPLTAWIVKEIGRGPSVSRRSRTFGPTDMTLTTNAGTAQEHETVFVNNFESGATTSPRTLRYGLVPPTVPPKVARSNTPKP
jgi:hypothetical protein